ncbi:MAG TPA: TonB-dependent receptor plug domain-containing protein, partial [Thermoanaerobaculia bacterium]|nr:TonB-dependent receptor plug domain-containing protein [Thermoanaerobaculia bacterium]
MRFVPRPFFRLCGRLAIAALAGFALAGPVAADEDCEGALIVAEKSYELGLFEDVPGQLAPCTTGESSRAESVNATALLAKTYIAMDDMDKARDAVADLLRLEPGFETATPPRFAALLREVRSSESELQVASVSKTSESLREAPATVVVIGADEIERRGYLDLEQLLHDLPGFDVSRGNGETYSTFYQRGFRSNDNDRLLLLVDGVEQNDIATGVAHVSRQFPIGAVERVEVVYGPASTIYGANAFSGVISIITKPPQAYLAPGKRFGAVAAAAGGAFGSRGTDLTLAGRDKSGTISWSITGRLFRSDEPDLSEFPGWQFDFSRVPYQEILRFTGGGIDEFCADVGCDSDGALLQTIRDSNGVARSITVTDAGAALARRMDEGLGLRFSDRTEDWSLNARLQLVNLTVGLEAWNLEEGTAPWYNGDAFARHAPGTWAPEHRSFFVKYGRSLGKSLSLNLFTRYRQTTLDPQGSARREIVDYANGRFSIVSLVVGCFTSFQTGVQVPCRPIAEEVEDSRLLATQTAAEVTLVYAPSRRFTLVSGLDLKKAAVQTRQQLLVTNELG